MTFFVSSWTGLFYLSDSPHFLDVFISVGFHERTKSVRKYSYIGNKNCLHYTYSGYRIIQNQITGGLDTDVPYHYSYPPPPNFRVITASSVSYNFSLHNKFSHTTRIGRLLRLCAFFISSIQRYRGGKELFRIKVLSLPYDPTFLQKNRLGAKPLRTLIRGGIPKVWMADKWVLQVITVLPPAPSLRNANLHKKCLWVLRAAP